MHTLSWTDKHTPNSSLFIFYLPSLVVLVVFFQTSAIWDCLNIELSVTRRHQSGALRSPSSPQGQQLILGWLVTAQSASAESSMGADSARPGGRSKREKMKGRGKRGSAEGPLLFPLLIHLNFFFPDLSLFCCVAITTSCYQFTFVKKAVLIRLSEGKGGGRIKEKTRVWISRFNTYLLVTTVQGWAISYLTAYSSS